MTELYDASTAKISIHAPRTGSDGGGGKSRCDHRDFNPRSPHGERPTWCSSKLCTAEISIHAPRTGSDIFSSSRYDWGFLFQSTLPARGATTLATAGIKNTSISIHAPRTGSDLLFVTFHQRNRDFNPRSPHGERPRRKWISKEAFCISIHAPRTGSDSGRQTAPPEQLISIHAPRTGSDHQVAQPQRAQGGISIHAPRTGSDIWWATWSTRRSHFNPRSPHGERPTPLLGIATASVFQSTLPARGATSGGQTAPPEQLISIHAPRTGSDSAK